jgi:hypothetical protein
VVWADVTQAIRAQGWIRGTVTFADGEDGTMWLSPGREIWAFRLGGSSYFYDGPGRVKFERRAGGESITKLPLGEDDAQRVLSMNALSRGESAVGHWLLGTEKVVSQERSEVTEAGKPWVEFRMTLGRGEMNRATLRVDPETRLPVSLSLASPTDADGIDPVAVRLPGGRPDRYLRPGRPARDEDRGPDAVGSRPGGAPRHGREPQGDR